MLRPKFNIADLFNLSGAVIYNPDDYKPTQWVSIDSREMKKGGIFVAVRGNRFDGHKFVADAIKNGAGAVIISERKLQNFDSVNTPILTVPNPIIAYGELANCWRHNLNATVVSITGSNGKTTTKETLAALLSAKYKVVKTKANNNNHIGVPLTILSARPGTEVLVLEHGTNHFGEIEYTAKIAEPDFALITNIGDSHLEYLKNREGVLNEKSALFSECNKNDGTCFINNDDPMLRKIRNKDLKAVTYGFKEKPDYKGFINGHDELGRCYLKISSAKLNFEIKMPLLGESNVQNFLAAFVVARQLKVSKKDLVAGVKNIRETPGRLNQIEFNNAVLIDDTYNSNPASTVVALNVIKRIKRFKKALIVLGDMFELGKDEKKLHRALAAHVKSLKSVEVYLIGGLMKELHKELKRSGVSSEHFNSREALSNRLSEIDFNQTKVLVKGSRGMRMEEFAEIIKSKAE